MDPRAFQEFFMSIRILLLAFSLTASLFLSGCASRYYESTSIGKFSGKTKLVWVEPNQFLFEPDLANPLTFSSADGKTITPGAMFTDGGSIPRIFWSAPGLSPWGYVPAYIVHDWLFEAKHCGYRDATGVHFPASARYLSEGIKTIMEANVAEVDKNVLYLIYQAVSSGIARKLWENGKCHAPGMGSVDPDPAKRHTILEIDIQ